MTRNLLISLLAIALGAGTAVAGEGHDHTGDHGHEAGAGDAPETEAFYGGDNAGKDPGTADHGHDGGHADGDSGHHDSQDADGHGHDH